MVEVPGVSQLTAIGSILVCSRNVRNSLSNVVIASTMIFTCKYCNLSFRNSYFLKFYSLVQLMYTSTQPKIQLRRYSLIHSV